MHIGHCGSIRSLATDMSPSIRARCPARVQAGIEDEDTKAYDEISVLRSLMVLHAESGKIDC